LSEVLLVEGLGILDVGTKFFGGFVAADGGVAVAINVAVCNVAATDERF
jgi:hypothetical protein